MNFTDQVKKHWLETIGLETIRLDQIRNYQGINDWV